MEENALFFIHKGSELPVKTLKLFLKGVPDDAIIELGTSVDTIRLDNDLREKKLYIEDI